MTLGERIVSLRKENNISQEELASIIGKSRTTMIKIENDKTTIDFVSFGKICECFDVSFNYLYYGKEVIKKNKKSKNSNSKKMNSVDNKKKNNILFSYKFKLALMIQTFCIMLVAVAITGGGFISDLVNNNNSAYSFGTLEFLLWMLILYFPYLIIYFIHFLRNKRKDINESSI
ncbi:MAG: helix-turn-helix domain-containing protein [Anaeroplasma sp.]|nr:helix-turn-helix domain-containing protein [Anaeroplasma sp.]